MSKQLAEDNTVFKTVSGSHLYGTATPESDRDYLGVMIEPPEYVQGLSKFEQWASPQTDTKNGPEDEDVTIYSMRKFAALAAKGNPNLLGLLFVPGATASVWSAEWEHVVENRGAFLSKQVATPFLGYMKSQLAALRGERGSRVHRPDLVAKHGYDTKFAYHALRLGLQGVEVLRRGFITYPIDDKFYDLTYLRMVRNGLVDFEDVLEQGDHLEEKIRQAERDTRLPDEPDYVTINKVLVDVHNSHWAKTKGV